MKRVICLLLTLLMTFSMAGCVGESGYGALEDQLNVSSTSTTQINGKMTISFQWKPEEGMTGTFDDSYELLFNPEDSFNYQPYFEKEDDDHSYELNPDGETVMEINLKEDIGLMDSGYYCLIKKFNIKTADGEEKIQELRFEFEG